MAVEPSAPTAIVEAAPLGGGGSGEGTTSSLGVRFYRSPNWRLVVTDMDSVAVTFLDRIASDRVIEFDLNTPTEIRGRVPSFSPEVNILHTDGDPFLAEGNRLLYAFRREGTPQVWVIRAAGIILDVEDVGDTETSRSTFTAGDPWAYLYSRQCVDADGDLPNDIGLLFLEGTKVGEIALTLLKHTIDNAGPVFLDAGTDWGGTLNYNGFIADTAEITEDYVIQRGKTVGEAWEDLCATGLMDIEITPIYDIDDRPGYVGELNIYSQPPDVDQPRGVARPQAIFSWDKPPRTLAGISRRINGRERANWIQFYTREGKLAAGLLEDAASIAKYGQHEYVQFFPDQIIKERVQEWATSQLVIRKRGLRSVTPLPSQQQPPLIWDEYFVGDLVPVYASRRLREGIPDFDQPDVYQRVYGITISLTNSDALEIISDIRVSQDGAVTE